MNPYKNRQNLTRLSTWWVYFFCDIFQGVVCGISPKRRTALTQCWASVADAGPALGQCLPGDVCAVPWLRKPDGVLSWNWVCTLRVEGGGWGGKGYSVAAKRCRSVTWFLINPDSGAASFIIVMGWMTGYLHPESRGTPIWSVCTPTSSTRAARIMRYIMLVTGNFFYIVQLCVQWLIIIALTTICKLMIRCKFKNLIMFDYFSVHRIIVIFAW